MSRVEEDKDETDALRKLKQVYTKIKEQINKKCKKKANFFEDPEGNAGAILSYLANQDSEENGARAIKAWRDYLEVCQQSHKPISNTRKKVITHLLKQYHNVNAAYKFFNDKIYNMSLDADERKWQAQALANQVRKQRIFEEVCESLYQTIPKALQKYMKERKRRLDWDVVGVHVEYLEFVSKQIRVQKAEGMQRRMAGIFREYVGERLEGFIHQKIDIYREVTSDLFMCAMMDLDVFGYLVVASEILQLGTESSAPQLSRISWVLQCITYKNKETQLTRNDFYKDWEETIKKETKKLRKEIRKVLKERDDGSGCAWIKKYRFCSLESIDAFLEDVQGYMDNCQEEEFTTTQKWIIRMFKQSLSIIWKITKFNVGEETIGDKEIWRDLSSEKAYYSRKEKLQEILKKDDEEGLCRNITAILNSPATFFAKKKILLPNEISFILSKYEKSCRNIFEVGCEYGNQKV